MNFALYYIIFNKTHFINCCHYFKVNFSKELQVSVVVGLQPLTHMCVFCVQELQKQRYFPIKYTSYNTWKVFKQR